MRIVLCTPAPRSSTTGNRATATRWARILRSLSHRVQVVQEWDAHPCDLLIALHAHKSGDSVRRFRAAHPGRPIVTGLAGTDIYGPRGPSGNTVRSMELSDRLIVLQPLAKSRVAHGLRSRVRVIYQSVLPPESAPRRSGRSFDVSVIAHLRPLKDPFRAALACRRLPAASRVRVLQVGSALTPRMAERAREEETRNPRYRWLGEVPRWKARSILARSRLTVIASKREGGANLVGEAVVAGTPILASRIDGNVGLLGAGHPGIFETGDTGELARLIHRAETDPGFLRALARHGKRLRPLFSTARETKAWRSLLRELREDPTSR